MNKQNRIRRLLALFLILLGFLAWQVRQNRQLAGLRGNSLNHYHLDMTNVAADATLTGDIDVVVSVTNANNKSGISYQYGDIALLLDGQPIAWGGDSALQADGTYKATLSLPTDMFSNGSHSLVAKDVFGNIATRTVTFNNPIANVSTDSIFDLTPGVTDVPSTCHITASLATAQPWTVTIQTTDDTPVTVRTFSGNSANIDVTWNGIDSAGTVVKDDVYTVLCQVQRQQVPVRRTVNKQTLH